MNNSFWIRKLFIGNFSIYSMLIRFLKENDLAVRQKKTENLQGGPKVTLPRNDLISFTSNKCMSTLQIDILKALGWPCAISGTTELTKKYCFFTDMRGVGCNQEELNKQDIM